MAKYEEERYQEIAGKLYNYEELLHFVEWYANKLEIMTCIDYENKEIPSEFSEVLHKFKLEFEYAVDKRCKNEKIN